MEINANLYIFSAFSKITNEKHEVCQTLFVCYNLFHNCCMHIIVVAFLIQAIYSNGSTNFFRCLTVVQVMLLLCWLIFCRAFVKKKKKKTFIRKLYLYLGLC